MKPKYHGWIYVEKQEGMTDHFRVTYYDDEKGDYIVQVCGYGAAGAAKAVDFFETDGGLGLGPIKLLPTPLGLRVYTEEEEVGDVYKVNVEVGDNHPDYQGMTLQAANDAFWAHISEGHPERTTGDMPVEEAVAFDRACVRAYNVWLRTNKQEEDD